jgi:hypothetical protein
MADVSFPVIVVMTGTFGERTKRWVAPQKDPQRSSLRVDNEAGAAAFRLRIMIGWDRDDTLKRR